VFPDAVPDPIGSWRSDAARVRSTPERCVTELAGNLTRHFANALASGLRGAKVRTFPHFPITGALLGVEGRR